MTNGEVQPPTSFRDWLGKRKPGEWVAVCILVAGTVCLSVLFFQFHVCDDQVMSGQRVERVCRHAQLADPPVAVIGLIMLATLGVFFSEVSGFGFTLKARVEEAKRDAGEAKRTATEAKQDAIDARREALDARLAASYNKVRSDLPAGPARDTAMYEAWQEMVDRLKIDPDFDVIAHLSNKQDAGMRLAGYAYVYTKPDTRWLSELYPAVMNDKKPFNQEMGLRALRALLEGHCDLLEDQMRNELKEQAQKFRLNAQARRRNSKRSAEIDEIFKQCPDQ
jgi:hypothetical protein